MGGRIGRWGVGGAQLFTVQSDPDYSGADDLFHGFTGLVPLLLFKGFLSDVASQLILYCRKNKKRIKIILPYVSNSYKLSDQGKGANCVVKIESGICGEIFFSILCTWLSWAPIAIRTLSQIY